MHGFHQDMVYIWILDGSSERRQEETKERDRQAKKIRQPYKQIYRQNDRKKKNSLQYKTKKIL